MAIIFNDKYAKPQIKIIIAGTRTFSDYTSLCNIIYTILNKYVYNKGYNKEQIIIVCGKAQGADTLGEKYAKENSIDIKYFPADWDTYGKSAGYIRNKQMAEYASSEKGYGALIAFWDGKSKGTKLMIDLAKQYHLKTFIFDYSKNKAVTQNGF